MTKGKYFPHATAIYLAFFDRPLIPRRNSEEMKYRRMLMGLSDEVRLMRTVGEIPDLQVGETEAVLKRNEPDAVD